MNPVHVKPFVFDFSSSVVAEPYEQDGITTPCWPQGKKVVDIVAHTVVGDDETWLIEAKDFRTITMPPKRSNLRELPQTMLAKVTDTLDGLAVIAAVPGHPLASHARAALDTPTKRAVLHLEPHPRNGTHSHLFPFAFVALVNQRLNELLAPIDPKPLVLSIATTPKAGVPWTVQ